MTRLTHAAAVAAVACAMALTGATAAQAASATAPQGSAPKAGTGEIDRNLLKPPPGGVLAPVQDLAGQLLPKM
ncbi:hypothetical protein ACFVIM_30105 [Streptomyces sp. NPDC057638]|uniref:hypothetical protein n=1 Tax=Streptomyces sp. NPDC057638 TaxID=3346190 RepID=UPI00369324F5